MILNDKYLRIKTMVLLIEEKRTGNANQLAKNINISRSKLYEIFEECKFLGIEIKFDRKINSFYFANNLRLKVNVPIQIITEEEYKSINGGQATFPYLIHKNLTLIA